MGYRNKTVLLARAAMMAMVVAASSTATTTAMAQSTAADRPVSVSINSQSLAGALRQLAETSGLQLVYDTRIIDGKTSPGVSGTMTAGAALSSLLVGSGLSYQFSGDRTAIITASSASGAAGAEDGVRAVGVVTVEGANGPMPFGELISPLNGTNGSRDVQSTEGTGSYTTGAASIGSKVPQTLRETPASVTVVTAQQIEDQALVSVRDIVERITGITVTTSANTEEFSFSSRGLNIRQVTVDGGAPLVFEYNNRPVLDMSEFDSVQLLRGAGGLFGGYGDPGGSINLVRRKPLDHRQITYEQDIGSWSNFREELDLTGPLGFEGRLRGRLVLSRTDKEQFFDIAEAHKSSIYGVMEYDVTPKTLLTFGGNYVQERNIPNQGGLPRYDDGTPIDFPRSTCLCVPWAYDDASRTELFANLDHQFNTSLSSRLNVTYNEQISEALYYQSNSIVRRGVSGIGSLGGFSTYNPLKQLSVDFSTNGKFGLFGREHSFVVGASYQNINNDGGRTTNYPSFAIADVLNFDPYAYAEPAAPDPSFRGIRNRRVLYGAYSNIRLELLSNLHVTAGVRYSSYKDDIINEYTFGTSVQLDTPPDLEDSNVSRPNLGFTYDFLSNFTLYGTYQSTYRPQDATRFARIDFTPPPVTGENEELGVKWVSPNQRLNAFVSVYNITQDGYLQEDFTNPGSLIPIVQKTTSQGIDFEVAGEVMTGLQVSFGYTYNDNITEFSTSSAPRSSYTPHNLLKTWMIYRGADGGPLDRYTFGAGLNIQSKSFAQGRICSKPPADPQGRCSFRDFVPYAFETAGYATVSARVGYELTDNVQISLNVDNITDEKTFASNPFQNISSYNYYIEPRSFVVSMRAKW